MDTLQQLFMSFTSMLFQELKTRKILTNPKVFYSILVLLVLIGAATLVVVNNTQNLAAHDVTPAPYAPGKVPILTYHYNNARTGQNLQEIHLTTRNVNTRQFGERSMHTLTGEIQAQPLYVPNVRIAGKLYNVVYVATTADQIYAFNADGASGDAPIWNSDLGVAGGPGIFGTPVIALLPGGGTLYVITNDGKQAEHLHALNITNGRERPHSPVSIQVPGLNLATSHERTGLLLLNGTVYGGWAASEFTNDVQHGWVIGYNATTLKLAGTFNTTATNTVPNNPGSVWQSVTGLAADAQGNIYPIVSNGPFDANHGGSDYGDSFVKLSTANDQLSVTDYFSPFDQTCLLKNDFDLGSGGTLVLPDQTSTASPHLMLSVSKDGRLYVVNRDNLGKFTADPALSCDTAEEKRTNIDHVVQESAPGLVPGLFMAPTYWAAPAGRQFVYLAGANADTGQGDYLKAFQLTNGVLNLTPQSQTTQRFGYPGVNVVVSSNGSHADTGIVWALEIGACGKGGCTPSGPSVLHAYAATNLHKELYNSQQNIGRDGMDSSMKFTTPIVADGKAFACSDQSLYIYGLLK